MNVVAVIPARAGSKRLPGKNIRSLGGRPLLAYSVEDALECPLIHRTLVSTDSPEVAAIAKACGAQTPFLRPAALSGDRVSDAPVLDHACRWLEEREGYRVDVIVLLRPTTPLRPDGLVTACLRRLFESDADSVRSVREVGHWHPYWMLRVDEHGLARPFLEGKTVDVYYQSQLLPPLYKHDGYCDVLRRQNLPDPCPPEATLAGMYGTVRAVCVNQGGPLVNIDTAEDFELAEWCLERQHGKHA